MYRLTSSANSPATNNSPVGFQFGLYHVVAPISSSRSISLASLFVTFYFWLIRSFTDLAFTGSIFVCGPLHHHISLFKIRSSRVQTPLSTSFPGPFRLGTRLTPLWPTRGRGLPFTLIRHKNGAFQKRSSRQRNLKSRPCVLVWTELIFNMELFENDDVTIITKFPCPSIPQTKV